MSDKEKLLNQWKNYIKSTPIEQRVSWMMFKRQHGRPKKHRNRPNKKKSKMDRLMERVAKKEKKIKQAKKDEVKYLGNGIQTWMGDAKGGPLDRGKAFYSK